MENYLNVGFNIETFIYILITILSGLLLIAFAKIDIKRYGLLFLITSALATVLCLLFVQIGFYRFPYLLTPKLSVIPISMTTLLTPVVVLFSVRYSPEKWPWKIPFYWVLVHIIMFCEIWALNQTRLIRYTYKWDLWDSYTAWWIYLLIFEWIGGRIIPKHLRKPLDFRHLQYGKLGWFAIHFVLILTIFIAGYYLGSIK